MEDKNNLRIKIKTARKILPIGKISEYIAENIRKSQTYITAKNVMIFYPKDDEVNLLDLLSDNKNFYLPRVSGENLEVCPYKLGDKLIKSKFGVLEPVTQPVSPSVLDLVIVPALAVDKHNNRLGYGKGYYDRFLAEYDTHFKTIVGIPKCFLFDEIPTETYDKTIDEIYFD